MNSFLVVLKAIAIVAALSFPGSADVISFRCRLTHSSTSPPRLATQVIIRNDSDKVVSVAPDQFRLRFLDSDYHPTAQPGFPTARPIFDRSHSNYPAARPLRPVRIVPGGAASGWLVFEGVLPGNLRDVPSFGKSRMELSWNQDDISVSVDLISEERRSLQLQSRLSRLSDEIVVIEFSEPLNVLNFAPFEEEIEEHIRSGRTNVILVPATPLQQTFDQALQAALERIRRRLKNLYWAIPVHGNLFVIGQHAFSEGEACIKIIRQLPEARERLLELAADSDPDVRKSVVNALSDFRDPGALNTIVRLSNDSERAVRQACARGLANYNSDLAKRALLSLVRDSYLAVRTNALVSLRKFSGEDIVDLCLQSLDDREMRVVVMDTLMALRAHRAIPYLRKYARDATTGYYALKCLWDLGDRQVVEDALEVIKTAPHAAYNAFEVLGKAKESRALPRLLELMSEQYLNDHAVNAVAQIGGKQAEDALLLLVKYGSPSTSNLNAALQAFKVLGAPSAIASLLQIAKQSPLTDQRRYNFIHFFGEIKAPGAVPFLEECLHGMEDAYSTSRALAQIGTPEARKALEKALESNNNNVKSAAQSALAQLK